MRLKQLTRRLAALALSLSAVTAAQAAAVPANTYNGVWQSDIGYIVATQTGNEVVASLLLPNGGYLAFYGTLSTYCSEALSPCLEDSVKANLNQVFVDGQVTLQVDFGNGSLAAAPTQAVATLTTCDTANGCLIPTGVPLGLSRIF